MPHEKQLLQVFEQSCQNLCGPVKGRVGRPDLVSGRHLWLTIMLCFLRGWNAARLARLLPPAQQAWREILLAPSLSANIWRSKLREIVGIKKRVECVGHVGRIKRVGLATPVPLSGKVAFFVPLKQSLGKTPQEIFLLCF